MSLPSEQNWLVLQKLLTDLNKKGYKIPAKEAELFDFINHGTTIIMPMLARLKKCRDIVKLGTANKIDLFDKTEYSSLKKYFDD